MSPSHSSGGKSESFQVGRGSSVHSISFLDFNFWCEDAAEDAAELKKVEEMAQ